MRILDKIEMRSVQKSIEKLNDIIFIDRDQKN